MSELFELMKDLANHHANMYRAAFDLGQESARQQSDENKERIESEDIPAKLAEDVGITGGHNA